MDEIKIIMNSYNDEIKSINGTIFDVFGEFYNKKDETSPIHTWLEKQLELKVVKNNDLSTSFRQKGNKLFGQQDLLGSFEFYTKGVCYAVPLSKEYSLAIANRSAVTFEMKKYKDCLKDIDLCLEGKYPKELKPKIIIRKTECLLNEKQPEKIKSYIDEIMDSIQIDDTMCSKEKEKYLYKFRLMKKVAFIMIPKNVESSENLYELPSLAEGENTNFAFASSKLKIGYDKAKGRHVLANKNIKRGDTLFIEKAFSFTPVFKKSMDFPQSKCYNCLKDILSSLPCEFCVYCIYCDTKCRSESWEESHKWECRGMQGNIWHYLGIAFPAFRTLLKGVPLGLTIKEGGPMDDVSKFGDHDNNYQYFNRLLSNIYKGKNLSSLIVLSSIVVCYLQNYTNFFTWFLQQPNCPKKDEKELITFIGGSITKHIGQLACNSSIIEHFTLTEHEDQIPDANESIACGIFPSVSIMNHSCKANVTNYFVCDTIVVKALEDINENQEIFNSYGVDYRSMGRPERQNECKSLYYFDCSCEICSNPEKEMELFDSFLCPDCQGSIPDHEIFTDVSCLNCKKEFPLEPFRTANKKIEQLLEEHLERPQRPKLTENNLLKALEVRQKILSKFHNDMRYTYQYLYMHYISVEKPDLIYKYFERYIEIAKIRHGQNSKVVGLKTYDVAVNILRILNKGGPNNSLNLRNFLPNINKMLKEAKLILFLYYPPSFQNRLGELLE